jgi:hypothetical protein
MELAPLASATDRPPATDLEDNQWEVKELQERRKVGRGFHVPSEVVGVSRE